MYKVYEKSSAIRQMQIYLENARQNGNYVAPTGVFDASTRDAVIEFQKKNELTVTGTINKGTLETLYKNYSDGTTKNQIMIKRGDYGDSIFLLNHLLIKLMNHYGQIHMLPLNGYFSDQTDSALKTLSKIYNIDYNSIKTSYQNLRKNISKN